MDCAGLADAYLIGMSEGPNFDAAMERRFQEYVEDLGTVVGNDARRRGLSDYMTGLLLPGERKSMEPIAERLESGNVSRRHQSIQHFVSEASWKDGPVRERVSVGSCRRCRSAAPLSTGSSMTRPCSRAAGMGSPSSIRAWSARRPTASQPVAGDRGRQHACELYLPED